MSPRVVMPSLVGVALLFLVGIGIALRLPAGTGTALAQGPPRWPTPPPGPPFPLLSLLTGPVSITPLPSTPGSETAIVQARWPGPIPLEPPVPQDTFVFQGQSGPAPIAVTIDAGTRGHVFQLQFTPLEAERVPLAWPGAQILRAFRLQAFDADARPIEFQADRPLVLRIPVEEFTISGIQPSRLLVAALNEEASAWQPLISAYYPTDQEVEARLLSLAALAVVYEPR